MTTNNTIQNLSDEELARLSDDELISRIDKNIAELGEVNDEVEKTNNTLVQDAPEDKPEQDVLDEKEDNKFIEETEDELDLGINEAILDLASDDDGEVE
jgi:hypothetical protein